MMPKASFFQCSIRFRNVSVILLSGDNARNKNLLPI